MVEQGSSPTQFRDLPKDVSWFAALFSFITLFSFGERVGLGRAVMVAVGVLACVAWMSSPFRRLKSYWLLLLGLALLNVLIVVLVPWPNVRLPGMAITPFFFADWLVCHCLAYMVLIRPGSNTEPSAIKTRRDDGVEVEHD